MFVTMVTRGLALCVRTLRKASLVDNFRMRDASLTFGDFSWPFFFSCGVRVYLLWLEGAFNESSLIVLGWIHCLIIFAKFDNHRFTLNTERASFVCAREDLTRKQHVTNKIVHSWSTSRVNL